MDNTQTQNLQAEFERLRSDDLLAIARNNSAEGRHLAIEMLIKRSSPLASHPDIAAEASHQILSDPRILKHTDPASISAVHKSLPGLMDVLYADIVVLKNLQRVVAENHSAQSARTSALEKTVADNHRVLTDAVSDQAKKHSYDITDLSAVVSALEKKISDLRAESEKRLALLERSLWRKVLDRIKARLKRKSSGVV